MAARDGQIYELCLTGSKCPETIGIIICAKGGVTETGTTMRSGSRPAQ